MQKNIAALSLIILCYAPLHGMEKEKSPELDTKPATKMTTKNTSQSDNKINENHNTDLDNDGDLMSLIFAFSAKFIVPHNYDTEK